MQDNASAFLTGYGELRRRVDHYRRALDDAKQRRVEEIAGMSAPMPDIGTRIQSGGGSDPVYSVVERLLLYHDERINKCLNDLRRAEFELDEMQAVIDRAGLSDVEKQYIELRYVQGLTVQNTAEQIGYSERSANLFAQQIKNKIANIKIFVDKYNNMC